MDTARSVGLPLWALALAFGILGLSPGVTRAGDSGRTADGEAAVPASAAAEISAKERDSPSWDHREDVQASAYGGYAVDTFAAGELGSYLNPGDSATLKERWIGGFDVDMRLTRGPSKGPQLWLYLETLHGVRSSDVDCSKNADLPVCKPFTDSLSDPTDRTLYILRNATSLEGFIGARFEIFTLHPEGRHPLRPYVSAQVGFVSVAGGSEDAFENVNLAAGLTVSAGDFQGSHLEAGFGRNQVFPSHPHRLVIDGLLSWQLGKLESVRPFAQIVLDSDLGPGADAIQTYFGFDFEIGRLFGKKQKGQAATEAGGAAEGNSPGVEASGDDQDGQHGLK